MTRVKRGTLSLKRRRKILSQVKGYRFGRSKKERAAREAIVHAGKYAFAHRRDKKADRRREWQAVINGFVRDEGITYSRFIDALKKKNIILNRKSLADLAQNHPAVFKKVVAAVK
ncbi:MAG TPA: 50S ribosomal protein L20 [Candidatus Paceibacterota bacterium]|nr:50S ribosomal protein L20 [Candidatus Paceibacterota bacterium]